MNLLYISISNKTPSGGYICRQNNRDALKEIKINFFEYNIALKDSKIVKIIDSLLGFKCGLTSGHINRIIRKIIKDNIDVVFIEPSLYGKLVKAIHKRTRAYIITFFHNCEYEIYQQGMKNKFLYFPLLYSVYVNEYYSMLYSNKCIFLTERDSEECKRMYGINCEPFYTPIAIRNSYTINKKQIYKIPSNLLFVGSYFYPNIHGLIWFINEVLPFVDYRLTIVGKGFEKEEFLNKINDKSKLLVKGFVDCLDSEYETADIVVQPVFEGSGMKTKTAECFMYGKPLITSSEGLVGYKENLEFVYNCNTAEQFITVLSELKNQKLPSFCTNLRECFEKYYSLEARIKNYRQLLMELDNV